MTTWMAFSIKESLRSGWKQFRAHSGVVLTAFLVVFAVNLISSMFDSALEDEVFVRVVSNILFGIVGIVVSTGATYITLKIAKGGKAVRRDIVPPFQVIWRYFAVNFLISLVIGGLAIIGALIGVAVVMGLLSLELTALAVTAGVVLGVLGVGFLIYVALRYSLASYAVLEGSGITESIRRSAVLTNGVKWKLALFVLVAGLLNLLGLLALVVGLLLTMPLTALAFANVYLKLKERV